MDPASLFREKTSSESRALVVFRADMIGCEEASWRELFGGFERLKAITSMVKLGSIEVRSTIAPDVKP